MTTSSITLRQAFRGFDLTPGQAKCVDDLSGFLNAGRQGARCFVLRGYAGTGKTFLLSGLVRHLKTISRNITLMAPTGRAAKVLGLAAGAEAATVHRTIYRMQDLKEYRTGQAGPAGETFKFYFDLAANVDPVDNVYVVDEASMLSNEYSEGEFLRFGSGRLLDDLIRYVNLDANDHCKQIILVGDGAQLPPVNSAQSPALDAAGLAGQHGLAVQEAELTDVVRHRAGSGILKNATAMRERIRLGQHNVLNVEPDGKDVYDLQHDELIGRYEALCGARPADHTIIIAHRNSTVKQYNELVRNRYFPGAGTVAEGDRVVAVANNYRWAVPVLNGEFGTVTCVGEPEEHVVFVNTGIDEVTKARRNVQVVLKFRDIAISFPDIPGNRGDLPFKIVENVLDSNERDLTPDEVKALYVLFKRRNPSLRAGNPDFKQALKSDPYFNALRVKYGYAITCHKAQGGEWQNAIVDFESPRSWNNESYFRWCYTATTRARTALYTLNAPRYEAGMAPAGAPECERVCAAVVAAPETAARAGGSGCGEASVSREILESVVPLAAAAGLKIAHVRHVAFAEHYTFEREGSSARVAVDYDGRNRIRRSRILGGAGELAEQVLHVLKPLEGRRLVFMAAAQGAASAAIPGSMPYAREFFEALEARVGEAGIRLAEVTAHSPYHHTCRYTADGQTAVVHHYFDRLGRTRPFVGDPHGTTSPALMKRIRDLTAMPSGSPVRTTAQECAEGGRHA